MELTDNGVSEIRQTGFWEALKIWTERPHLVNNRVMVVKMEALILIKNGKETDACDILRIRRVSMHKEKGVCLDTFLKILADFGLHTENVEDDTVDIWNDSSHEAGTFIIFRQLFPKQPEKFEKTQEFVYIDKQKFLVIYSPLSEGDYLCTSPHPYSLSFLNGRICLKIHEPGIMSSASSSIQWLQGKLLPKVSKWAASASSPDETPKLQSLSLIPVDKYSETYQKMKLKYGKRLVEMWPETTDPQKFVYEDLAIASYLLVLWEQERSLKNLSEKQTFVDLGCGNGLLVYVLAEEGHKGIGVDVQKRRIWSMYGPATKLIEMAITPSDKALFPDYDWIIGNHSDELTPWIPAIAARSSYKTRVFLLPCCAYDFGGKFVRKHHNMSLYQSYLKYVDQVCSEMGFTVLWDRLRIPSTKRVCLVCMSRNYEASEEEVIEFRRTDFIKTHQHSQKKRCENAEQIVDKTSKCDVKKEHTNSLSLEKGGEGGLWITDFKVREKQKVLNCTQLDRTFLNSTISNIVSLLLKQEQKFVEVTKSSGEHGLWNKGGTLHLEDLAKMLGPKVLAELKNQCGGLQTLVRNHKHVLKVDKGIVSLSIPEPHWRKKEVKGTKRLRPNTQHTLKRKPCWFFNYHPDKCPLSESDCSYIHQEL